MAKISHHVAKKEDSLSHAGSSVQQLLSQHCNRPALSETAFADPEYDASNNAALGPIHKGIGQFNLTVMIARDFPTTKRYYLDESGQVGKRSIRMP